MNDRDFLNKIRKLQETGQKVNLTILNEQFKGDAEEGQDISPEEQREEENAFKDTVTQLVEFKKIKVFKKNVEWSGRLVRERINWIYSLEDQTACYISVDSDDLIQLTDTTLETIKKIRAYYDIWADEWGKRLTGGSHDENTGGF